MKIVFMGTPDFAVTILTALEKAGHDIILCVTQPDRPKGRKGLPQPSPVKEWAVDREIPVFQPDRIRKPENVETLRQYPADVFVVAAYGQILPESILSMPRLGCINVHASLLPAYRGAAPIQWAILSGDRETGVTTMQMGPGLDDGDILCQTHVPIGDETTGGELFDILSEAGGDLIVSTLSGIAAGTVHPIPQDESKATHVGMIQKSLGNLDWSRPASELHNYVRGLNPWPSAYSFLHGKMVKIWRSSVPPAEGPELKKAHAPGEILSAGPAGDGGIRVQTGEGVLSLLEVQEEGRKRMSVDDFLRGHAVTPGERFASARQ